MTTHPFLHPTHAARIERLAEVFRIEASDPDCAGMFDMACTFGPNRCQPGICACIAGHALVLRSLSGGPDGAPDDLVEPHAVIHELRSLRLHTVVDVAWLYPEDASPLTIAARFLGLHRPVAIDGETQDPDDYECLGSVLFRFWHWSYNARLKDPAIGAEALERILQGRHPWTDMPLVSVHTAA
jgi:hypothetical protein